MSRRHRFGVRDAELAMMRLLSKRQVAEIVQMHPESIMRLAREGKFPRFIKIGTGTGGAVRFVESDIEDWIKQKRFAESNGS